MRFWSEGLGDRQLVMGLGKARIEQQGEVMLLSGVVDSPAPWEYEVKIQREDWETILKTAVSRDACGFIAGHASLGLLIGMAWSIIRFVVLLAFFRLVRMVTPAARGHGRTAPEALAPLLPASGPEAPPCRRA